MLRRPLSFTFTSERYALVDRFALERLDAVWPWPLEYVPARRAAILMRSFASARSDIARTLSSELMRAYWPLSVHRANTFGDWKRPPTSDELATLFTEGLGRPMMGEDGPPRSAHFHLMRELCPKPPAPPPFDPCKEQREAIEAAEKVPRGWVAFVTVDAEGVPLPGVRCEVLLADGEVRTVHTKASGEARLEPIPQGQCHIRLPDLDGSAWKPEAGAPSSRVDKGYARLHVVQRGENVTLIARRYGIKGWIASHR